MRARRATGPARPEGAAAAPAPGSEAAPGHRGLLSSGTGRRLGLGFASLLVLFGVGVWAALHGMTRIHQNLQQTIAHERAMRTALELTSAVHDQYAYQAHTVIVGDQSRLPAYREARERVLALSRHIRGLELEEAERAGLARIEEESAALDAIFRERIVPAVERGEAAEVRDEHERAQQVVSRIEGQAGRLVELFEASIRDYEAQARAVEQATIRWAAALLIGALVLAALIALWLARSIARPVALLREGAARLAGGELEARIALDGPEEFADLARQFNAMTRSLKEHQERLVQSEKLAGIGRLAAGVAHEISNPLGVILGYTRVLERKAEGALREDLAVIGSETLRCQEIVDGLLDLSRPLKGPLEPVDLRELCEEVVGRLKEVEAGRAVEVQVEGAAVVQGQASRLRQVLFNLVKNGAEAAGPGGRVEVRLAQAPGGTRVSVADTGRGISPEDQAKIFEPFFTTKQSGTGLGLAVSQAIAQAHGGGIELASAQGRGATFTLWLPGPGPG